jgi:hypothetical protein
VPRRTDDQPGLGQRRESFRVLWSSGRVDPDHGHGGH